MKARRPKPEDRKKPEAMCACGQPLHYSNAETQRWVEFQVAELGPTIDVTLGSQTWQVPRHYIALHGLKGSEIPELAEKFGWKEL